MKIAQVAPLFESVPPKYYGGTERVIHYLTEELVRMGHDVTLFASGDSVTSARLISPCDVSLRLNKGYVDYLVHHVLLLEQVARLAGDFDVIHFHIDYMHFPLTRNIGLPSITTLHGRLDLPDLQNLYREFDDIALVSISDAQREPIAWANWLDTVHHGLPPGLLSFREKPDGYLAFLGRISPEKRVDRAIQIARRAGMELKIAAKVDPADYGYFKEKIEPLLSYPGIHFIGEIGEKEKADFLGGAHAMLFPIDWPEPFGLVMIEAMACGTPVVAFRGGSVGEVLEDGVTGFICDSIDGAVGAVRRAVTLDRREIRRAFERRFTASRMAAGYLSVYRRVIASRGGRPEPVSKAAA